MQIRPVRINLILITHYTKHIDSEKKINAMIIKAERDLT